MRSLLLSLLLIIAVATAATADGITVSQSVDRSQIAYEDSLTFAVTLQWPGPQYAYRFDRPLEPSLQGLKVASFASSISSSGVGVDETTTKVYRFKLAPTAAGQARIEAIGISFVSYPDSIPGQLMTEPVNVTVARQLPVSEPGGSTWIWTLIVLGVAALGAVVLWLYLRSTRHKSVTEIELSPAQLALEQLVTAHRESAGDFKKFQSGLYKILNGFLSARFGIEVEALDDEGLNDAIDRTSLPERAKEKISEWLIAARKDKFRPVAAAPGEAIRLESEVRELFEKL